MQDEAFPRAAARAVSLLVARRYREEVLTDLSEEWLAVRRARGAYGARLWYWKEAALTVCTSWWHVLRAGSSVHPPSSERDGWLFTGLYDWRHAIRGLVHAPRFTIAALMTLTLGIWASVSVFGLVSTILLKPLPFSDPDRLIQIETTRGGEVGKISLRELEDLHERSTSFADIASFVPGAQYSVATGQAPQKATAILASHNLFHVLGAPLLFGGTFPAEYDRERHNALILSHRVWQSQFGGNPDIVGRTVAIDASPEATPRYTVAGVTPAGFDFPARTDLYRSAFIHAGFPDGLHRGVRNAIGIGRLRDGVTIANAREEISVLFQRLAHEFPESNESVSVTLTPLQDVYTGPVRPHVLVLFGAVLTVLLVAGVNVANLFLSRALDRQPQLAMRRALGATRARLIGQLSMEGAALAVIAGALAVGLAQVSITELIAVMRLDLPSWMVIDVDDWRVLLFALAVSLTIGLIAALVPALTMTLDNESESLRAAGSRAIGSARQGRLRRTMVIAEIAISVFLLIGASLMLQTFHALWRADVGFTPRGLLTLSVGLPAYYSDARTLQFQEELLDRLERLPGVTGAATNANLPLANVGQADRQTVVVEGQDGVAVAANPYVNYQRVSPRYFDVMQIPMLRGRAFDGRDRADGAEVAVVSRRVAERFWPGQDAIGKRLSPPGSAEWRVVIGVVGDVKHQSVTSAEGFDVYFAAAQSPDAWSHFIVRATDAEPGALTTEVQRTVWAMNPEQPVTDIASMQERIGASAWQQRASAFLLSVFACIALLLASVGIYGVMSYSVGQRLREFGLRRALGARRRDLAAVVLREIAHTAGVGALAGLALAAVAAQWLRPLLYGVAPLDITTFVGVPVIIALVALIASLGPARRAARIDPLMALRALLLILIVIPSADAQTASGSLQGHIVDQTSAGVAGATVTLTNVDTGVQAQTTSTVEGAYAFQRVAPGRYALTVEREGFTREIINDLTITVGQAAVTHVTLTIGTLSDTLTVVAPSIGIQSRTSSVSEVVNDRRVRELPLNGKDFNKLVILAPGVVATPSSSAGSPAVSGARSTANNYTLDGVSTNDERVDGLPPGAGFSTLGNALPNIISTEAIQEFRVVTSNADATNGRGSGGQINVVTKSGTNRVNGSVYGFGRNESLDAKDYFNTGPYFDADGTPKNPPFRQGLYGASLGGPLVKSRHFFFGNFEGIRQRRESITSLTLLNADFINLIPGDLGRLYRAVFIDSGVVPAAGNPRGTFSPIPAAQRAAAIAGGFPTALFDGGADNGEAGTVLVSSAAQSDFNQDAVLLRTDHQLSTNWRVTARYAFNQNEALSGVVTDQIREPRRWQSYAADSAFIVSPTQLLELRLGRQLTENSTRSANAVDASLAALGVNAETGIFVSPNSTGARFIRIRGANAIVNDQPSTSVVAQHIWSAGRLTLKMGAELRWITADFRSNIDLPTYNFTGFVGENGLLGTTVGQSQAKAESIVGTVFGRTSGPATPMRSYTSTQQEYFAQGDWRLRDDLTLNLGLRYSFFGVYNESSGAISNLYTVDGNHSPIADVSPLSLGRTANNFFPIADDRPFYQPDRNNVQPRLGIAWDIGGRGNTIVRAAYGGYYDRIAILEFSDIVGNTPFAFSTGALQVPFTFGAPIPDVQGVITGVAVDPTIRNPRTDRFNAAIERRLSDNASVALGYVGARGHDLLRYQAINATGAVPLAQRPDARFGNESLLTNASSSQYDALQITGHYNRRALDLTAYYTYAKSYDDVSAAYTFSGAGPALINLGASAASGFQGGGSQFVPRPVDADWGPSNFDVRHQLVLSHLIELPFGRDRRFLRDAGRTVNALVGGWSVAGVAQVRSGLPFTVTLGADVNDDGALDERPMLIAGALEDLYARGSRGPTQYLLPQADAQARLGTPNPLTDPFVSVGRNAFRSPTVAVYDLSLIKRVGLTDRVFVQLELNAFNLLNRANLNAPISDLSNVRFGQITSTLAGSHGAAGNPRQLQIGAKVTF